MRRAARVAFVPAGEPRRIGSSRVAATSSGPGRLRAANMPLVEAAEDGWWFSAALPDGTLLVAYFTDADLLPSSGALMVTRFWRLLERAPFTRQQLPDSPTRHCFHRCAADSQWRPAREPHRLAVGDALMALDPLCGRGIVAAIESGRGAANALLRCDGGDVAALDEWQMAQRRVYERVPRTSATRSTRPSGAGRNPRSGGDGLVQVSVSTHTRRKLADHALWQMSSRSR